jgi:hypothetical protein
MKELAIFRHFYHLNQEQALSLPLYEWENLIENYNALEAERVLANLYCTSFGFNGGEGFQKFQEVLLSKIEISDAPKQDFRTLESYGDEEKNKQWEAFLHSI